MTRAFGITMGGGVLIPDDLLQAVKGFGWTHIRQGNRDDTPLNAALAQQIRGAGLTPVMGILRASQLPRLPLTDEIVEVSSTGYEATADAPTEAAALNAVAAVVKAKRLRAYVGMKGTSKSDLAWTAQFVKLLDPVYGICVHRYPPARATTWDAPQWQSRAFELQQLHDAIGPRHYIVGEFGWNSGRYKTRWDYLFFWRHTHLTDQQQYDAITGEFTQYWQLDPACDVAVLYQMTDGPDYCTTKGHETYTNDKENGFGIRRVNPDGSHKEWKPSARIPQLGSLRPAVPASAAALGVYTGSTGE